MSIPDPARYGFLSGGGEMAGIIQAFDWSTTSLGPLSLWPARVRAVVSLILRARLPMVVFWHDDSTAIYNDSYRTIAGSRHPALLGSRIRESWPELAASPDGDVIRTVLSGQAVSYVDQHVVVSKGGVCNDIWFDLHWSPLLDDDAVPEAALATVMETTERVDAEQRLRVAQRAGGVGTFEWYPESGKLDVSDEFRRIWDIPADQPVTDAMLIGMIEAEDRPRTGPARFHLPNPLEYTEYRIRRASDGAQRWISRRGEVIPVADGGPRRFLGVAIDITDRKHAEEAVRQSEARWRGLFEEMQEGFFVAELVRDADGKAIDFRFLEANRAFEQHTGLVWNDTNGRRVREVIPTIEDSLIANYARVVDTGRPMHFEVPVEILGGRWFEARARPAGGDRFAVLFLDITDRKSAEAALAESEGRFRSLAQSLPAHVWIAMPDGRLRWFNDRILAYAGADAEELAGDRWISLVHPDDRQPTQERWGEALASGSPYHTEFRLRRHDGTYRWHVVRAVPIRDEKGEIQRWVGSNSDIESQKVATETMARLAETLEERVAERTAELTAAHEALRQSQKMEAVGQLTGGIAHDFNNLLQGIVGSLDLVRRRIAQGRVAEVDRFVAGAMGSAERAAALTHRLLAFSRRQPLDPKPVQANPLVASMEELLRRTIGKDIRLVFALGGALWQTRCDPNQLENAILNLVINARDAMPEGGQLTIETYNAHLDSAYTSRAGEMTPGQYVCIAVTDTGSGMAPEVIERAFEPFFTTKPIGMGTGLGLSMIYGFARQSEGHAKIYSEVGIGTTVKLYLPRHLSEDAEQAAAEKATDEPAGTQPMSVLVVEDDAIVRGLVVEVLKEAGHSVLEAEDGVTGLQMLQSSRRIALLITDVGLPGLNGRQVADGGRAVRPDLKVLFMTGYAESTALARGFLEPGMAMITKPFPLATLASRIRMILEDPG
ncbi:PAS domain S-box protein [Geminicoccus roseus]|uniref:PAS domain S-box protein n=1 Tax=Geminicoccus roseus TaxID=404900 RepID=UPI000401CC5C|nr:PAS domain S-box protein [Geminicoccus roseus]